MKDRAWPLLNLVFALAAPLTTALTFHDGAAPLGDPRGNPPIVPASWAFSIWGPIYGALIVWAAVQLWRPAWAGLEGVRRAQPFAAVAIAGLSVWLVLADARAVWATVVCFAVLFAALVRARAALVPVAAAGGGRAAALVAPIDLFLGWTTVAVVANLVTALDQRGFPGLARSDGGTAAALVLAGAFAVGLLRLTRGSLVYAGAVAWALLAIVARNLGTATVAGAAGALLLAVGVMTVLSRAHNGAVSASRAGSGS